MCLRFVFLLTTRAASWLRLSRRQETWKTAEILILRHQLAVLQRRQSRRPHLVGFLNSATGVELGFYAARSYSLMRPPRTGGRLIRCRDRSAGGSWAGAGAAGGCGGVVVGCSDVCTRPGHRAGAVG